MRTSTIIAAAAAALASFTPAAEAQAEVPSVPGEVRIYFENDFFNPFPGRGTDRFYTQGMRGEWLSHSLEADKHFLPGVTHEDWCSLVCGADAYAILHNVNTGYALGHNIYTPENITIAAPQPFDRPWAGLLYGSRIARITYQDRSLKVPRQDRIEVSLGIVGPASLANDLQIWWHDVINDDHPAGWDNQLSNELVVQLRYETALRLQMGDNADFVPRVRAHLGNALISLEAEVTGRIGWNLSGFGVPSVEPAPPAPAAFAIPGQKIGSTPAKWRPGGNLFLRGGISAVAHNIFLDGNSFASNDIRIDRKAFVPEIAAGVELNLIPRVTVTYQFIRRGSEFESRRGRDAPAQEFGAITVAYTIGS